MKGQLFLCIGPSVWCKVACYMQKREDSAVLYVQATMKVSHCFLSMYLVRLFLSWGHKLLYISLALWKIVFQCLNILRFVCSFHAVPYNLTLKLFVVTCSTLCYLLPVYYLYLPPTPHDNCVLS